MSVTARIIYLNFAQADSGVLAQMDLRRDYVLACRFMHCGVVDRTGTLDPGFPYAPIDRIPAAATDGVSFAELCDTIGAEIVDEASRMGREIRVLWSGGIDSTAALIATMRAAEARGYGHNLRVLLSLDSVHENPAFFLRHIDGRYAIDSARYPISAALDPAACNVTGEHGDQLFGSQLLEPYVRRGLADVSYREIFPLVVAERLRSIEAIWRLRRYLDPVIAAAPVPIRTLFDCMWWLNFALKWQDVSLRLAALRGADARAVSESLHHFFRDPRFQAWSLAQGSTRCPPTWARYKDAAKQYILDFTGDHRYYRTKVKEDSLRNVIVDESADTASRLFMTEDFRAVTIA